MSRRSVSLARQIAEWSRASLANSLHTRDAANSLTGHWACGFGRSDDSNQALDRLSQGGASCAADVLRTLPILNKTGRLRGLGVEPYDLEDANDNDHCKRLVHKGIVRVADVKYLNRTLPELTRVASDSIVIFTGYPGQRRARLVEMSKFGCPAKLRSSTWWIRFFIQNKLEENEIAANKFEQTSNKLAVKPYCQVFHLKQQTS